MAYFKKARFFLLFGMLAAVALSVFYIITASQVKKPSVVTPVKKEGDAEISIRNFQMEESAEGKISWKVKADLAEKFRQGNKVRLQNLELTLHSKDGHTVTITGEEGLLDNEKKEMTISRKQGALTRVLFENGYILSTPTLHWSEAEKMADTDAAVTLEGRAVVVTGVGMRAYLDIQKVEVLSNVKAVIKKR